MGMLYVDRDFRRKGIGSSLEAYLINRQRELDWTPFCRICPEDQVMKAFQEKLGLYLSKENSSDLKILLAKQS